MTEFTITASEREQLAAAFATRTAAEDRHRRATEALARARQVASDAQAEADRLETVESSWIERQAARVAAWVRDPKGAPPALSADAKSQLSLATARANAQAAAAVLPEFEALELQAREDLAGAEGALQAAFRLCCATHVAAMLARREELIREADELRWLSVAPHFAAEVEGLSAPYARLLSAEQIDQLDRPPPHIEAAAMFAPHRYVVHSLHTPIGAARTELASRLDYWSEFQAQLEEIAAGSASAQEAA